MAEKKIEVSSADLLKRIEELENALALEGVERKAATDARIALQKDNDELLERLETGDFAPIIGRQIVEKYAGVKKITVKEFDPKTREYKKVEREARMWDYLIDLAPCGGTEIKISGQPLVHGKIYTLDEDTLRSVKEIVFRTWRHEWEINGNQESKFRKQQLPVFSEKLGRRVA